MPDIGIGAVEQEPLLGDRLIVGMDRNAGRIECAGALKNRVPTTRVVEHNLPIERHTFTDGRAGPPLSRPSGLFDGTLDRSRHRPVRHAFGSPHFFAGSKVICRPEADSSPTLARGVEIPRIVEHLRGDDRVDTDGRRRDRRDCDCNAADRRCSLPRRGGAGQRGQNLNLRT